jgi:hypothetical protein
LVISIIVILILAGVSLSATVGENGVITKAQQATLTQKIANYLEEFELNKTGKMIEQGIYDELSLNLLGTDAEFLEYVPSITDDDKNYFEIIGGYLVYTGDDSKTQEIAQNLGLHSQYDQVLYDVLGKEFKTYCDNVEAAKASGAISASVQSLTTATFNQINSGLDDSHKIPEKYKDEFVLSSGILTYTGTNEERLILLSTSSTLAQYIRPTSGNAKLILQNYVAPITGSVASTSTDNGKSVYRVQSSDGNYWTVRVDSVDGSIKYGTITKYEGIGGTITVPDRLDLGSDGIINVIAVEGKGTGSGTSRAFSHNIFQDDSGNSTTTSKVQQVIVAKGIYQIKNYALSKIGDNVPFMILHDGADLNLDEGTGIEGSCGSYTFTASVSGTYTLKCWGASGAGWNKTIAETNNWGSDAGYGGYSEGKVTLSAGEKLYVNIGGKGLTAFEVSEDVTLGTSNGSGGYNGGGNIQRRSAISNEATNRSNNAGGGCTDIRFGGSTYEYQILVAGGGGGVDDFSTDYINDTCSGNCGRNLGESYNDGSGGAGGGTVSATDKTTWSGGLGYINGLLENSEENILTGLNQISNRPTGSMNKWINGYSLGGWWILDNGTYVPKGYQRLLGEEVNTNLNYGAGGGGYYGGTRASHQEGGGGGGSAYADIEGTLKLVTDVRGYVDLEELTRSDGTVVKGYLLQSEIVKVTYYGREKDSLTYGNGYVAIER